MKSAKMIASFLTLILAVAGLWGPSAAFAQAATPYQEWETVDTPTDKAESPAVAVDPPETIIESGTRPDYVQWLLDVAIQELGYTEGPNNLTKYGAWAGDPNAEWCAEFLCWCVDQVDQARGTELLRNVYPKYGSQNVGRDWFVRQGRFIYRKGYCPGWGYQWLPGENTLMKKNDYIPRPGDWMFFSYNTAGDTEHVALVEYASRDSEGNVIIHVIEGNNPSSVQRNRFYLDNSQVLGFGTPTRVAGTTMRSGNQGEAVLWLQQGLNTLGFLGDQHLTGIFSSNTKAAVSAFQATMPSKNVNGIADMATQEELTRQLAIKEIAAPETWLVVD